MRIETAPIDTAGDAYRGPLEPVGGKGLFTAELESAMRRGEIDLAVHSAKDLPAMMDEEFSIAAVPPRADARDALISQGGGTVDDLPQGATVATSSPRRAAQLLAMRKDLKITPLRGNVETRLEKVLGGAHINATVLAVAGLERIGLIERYEAHIRLMEIEQFIPAAGQGALAVQILRSRMDLSDILRAVNDPISQAALLAERSVVRGLGADCRSPLGVHVRTYKGRWCGRSFVRPGAAQELIFVAQQGDSAQDAADKMLGAFMQRDVENIRTH